MGGGRNDYNSRLGLPLVGLGVAGFAVGLHQAAEGSAHRILIVAVTSPFERKGRPMTDLEKELYDVLDLIVAEFRLEPAAIAHFDSQTVLRATRLVDDNQAARRAE